jgi:hypothetical protein
MEWYPEVVAQCSKSTKETAERMKQSPMYQLYSKIAPRPDDWPVLITKVGNLLSKDYDWSADVAAIKTPTALVFADTDAVRPEHAVQFFPAAGRRQEGWRAGRIRNIQCTACSFTGPHALQNPFIKDAGTRGHTIPRIVFISALA